MAGRKHALGKIVIDDTVPTQITATDIWCESFMIEPWHENTGKIFWGYSATIAVDGTELGGFLPIPHKNVVSTLNSGKGTQGVHSYNLADLYFLAEVDGDSITGSYDG
jgi:hypothetical protein